MDVDFETAFERISYAKYLGMRYDQANEYFVLPFRQNLVGNNNLPALHGGTIGAYLENTAMIWLLVVEAQQKLPKPVNFSVDYLRLAHARETYASCEVLKQGRLVAQASVKCWQDDPAKPVAVGRGHFMLEELDL